MNMGNMVAFLLLLVIVGGCAAEVQDGDDAVGVVVTCDTVAVVGGKSICLPTIAGMQERSGSPSVRNRPGALIKKENTILGIYLTDAQAKLIPNLDEVTLDDYFKVYVVGTLVTEDFKPHQLQMMVDLVNQTALKRQWSEVSQGLEQMFEGVQFGQPVLMESYRPNDAVASSVYLSSIVGDNGFEYYLVMTMSLCSVKDRLVWVTHYVKYDGDASVKHSKSKSDYFTLRLVDVNKP